MKYGIIDIGSNTIRLAVYHDQRGEPDRLFTKKVFAQAVSYKRDGILSPESICVITRALRKLSAYASHLSLERLWCFATACLRDLNNCAIQLNGIRLADQHCPSRIFTLIPGIVILHEVMAFAGASRLQLASAGVREGYLMHELGLV